MNTKLVSRDEKKVVFTSEISPEAFQASINKVYNKMKSRFNIPGFRKGKAPRKIIELNYGEGIFFEDAVNELLPELFEEAIKELEIAKEICGMPKIDIEEFDKNKAIIIKFDQELKPVPELGDYKNLVADDVKIEVTDEIVDERVNKERENNARIVSIEDRPIKDMDTVNIDFEGSVEGVPFDGGKSENYDLVVGSHTFIPGFEEQLIGKNIGDNVDVNVIFPEEYHSEELKGKEALFKVKINSIKEKQLPELDDEFAQDVSEFDTLDEYRADIKKNLVESAEKNALVQKQNNAIDALIESSNVEAPESMINEEVDKAFRDFAGRIRQYNMSLDNYFKMLNTTEEAVREQLRPEATKRANAELVIDAFAKLENIEVSEEEIDKEIDEFGKNMKVKDFEEFKKELKSGEGLEGITASLIRRKAVDHLVSLVKFQEPKKETVEE
ncbi:MULTISPECIES: trigger factor [unclassified Parvimonas]|uniref:trigger factor n=1 Tax=unclassified Parvimonas TaxID=1151464 RepID=UPI002B46BBAB|nr:MULTISPECIES: trigger factor [unclassified Parvimonas]MEB3025764.1 trigger factor [Parvimonas sp. M13]MEB3072425.1 trigger factor [Parvimonas sp. C2]MEB3089909.1 trigger factor [Parvimonas sp. M20]